MGFKLNKAINLSDLASYLDLAWEGLDITVQGVSSLDEISVSEISFSKTHLEKAEGVGLIMPADVLPLDLSSNGFILSSNPRLDFIRALAYLQDFSGFSIWNNPPEIHPSVVLGQNVVVENGCVIGENSIIEHNVVIHSGTKIGRGSRVRSCSSIGGDGFGFERLDNDLPLRFPHLGGVTIGDNVEIGSCTAISRGTLSNTVIENNVKIDNLVHIAHNCLIKNGAFIIACAEVSGGVVIGNNAWISPNSSINQKITIGENSLVGLGAVVTKDVEPSCIYAGNPARKLREIE